MGPQHVAKAANVLSLGTQDVTPVPYHSPGAAGPYGIEEATAAWSNGSNEDADRHQDFTSTSCAALTINANQVGNFWGDSTSENDPCDGTQDVWVTGDDAELAWGSPESVISESVFHYLQLENADSVANDHDISVGADAAADAWLSDSVEGVSPQGAADIAADIWLFMTDAESDDANAHANAHAVMTVSPLRITLPHTYSGADFAFLDESWLPPDFNFDEEDSDDEDSSDKENSDDEDNSYE